MLNLRAINAYYYYYYANAVRIAVRANSVVISVVMSVRCCCAHYHTYILLAQKSRALCVFQSTGNNTNIL